MRTGAITTTPTQELVEHLRDAIADEAQNHGLTVEEAKQAIVTALLKEVYIYSGFEFRKPEVGETVLMVCPDETKPFNVDVHFINASLFVIEEEFDGGPALVRVVK